MVRYPVTFKQDDNDTILVSFPDFPEAHTFGEDKDDAMLRARDALATIVDGYIRARRELPKPSATRGNTVALSALMSAKVDLYNAMMSAKVNKSELARRLKAHPPQVDRLLDLRHSSQLDQLEAAANALGAEIDACIVMRSSRTDQPRLLLVEAKTTRKRVAGVHPGILTGARAIRAGGSLKTAASTKKK